MSSSNRRTAVCLAAPVVICLALLGTMNAWATGSCPRVAVSSDVQSPTPAAGEPSPDGANVQWQAGNLNLPAGNMKEMCHRTIVVRVENVGVAVNGDKVAYVRVTEGTEPVAGASLSITSINTSVATAVWVGAATTNSGGYAYVTVHGVSAGSTLLTITATVGGDTGAGSGMITVQ